MIVAMQRKTLNTSGQILRDLWRGNTKRFISYLYHESSYLDSMEEKMIRGEDEIIAYLRTSEIGILIGEVVLPDFYVSQIAEDMCVVAGTYTVESVPGSARRFKQRHQATFIWKAVNDELKILHYHTSLMNGDEADEKRRDSVTGTHEYTTMLKQIRDERAIYPITDRYGKKYLLESADILWIESDRNYIIVKRADGQEDITVRIPFKDFMKQMPDQIVVITRGKAVNFEYVESLHRNQLNLADGSTHSVSRLYMQSLKSMIAKRK